MSINCFNSGALELHLTFFVKIELIIYSLAFSHSFYQDPESIFCLCSDYLFKLLLIGDSGVGKSCLLLRFAVCRFHSSTLFNILWKVDVVPENSYRIKLHLTTRIKG